MDIYILLKKTPFTVKKIAFAQKNIQFIKQFLCFYEANHRQYVYQNKTLFLGRLLKNDCRYLTIPLPG